MEKKINKFQKILTDVIVYLFYAGLLTLGVAFVIWAIKLLIRLL